MDKAVEDPREASPASSSRAREDKREGIIDRLKEGARGIAIDGWSERWDRHGMKNQSRRP